MANTRTAVTAPAQTYRVSTDVEVAADASLLIGLYTDSTSGEVPGSFEINLYQKTPGGPRLLCDLSKVEPMILQGPCTVYVVFPDVSSRGVNIGLFTEA